MDYVIIGGNSSQAGDLQGWIDRLTAAGLLAEGEQVYFLEDVSKSLDVNERLEQLNSFLEEHGDELSDIKFIGHSEGAATLGTFWANHFDGTSPISDSILSKTTGVFLLDCPTGTTKVGPWGLKNYDSSKLNGVGDKLAALKIKSADIFNSVSWVHNGSISGWNSKDTATGYDIFSAAMSYVFTPFPLAISAIWGNTSYYHERIKDDAMTVIKDIFTQ